LTDRRSEWFVPKFGPPKFRLAVGLLFLPYTGMVMAFLILGSVLSEEIYWDRLLAIAAIYFLGLGVAAHALDGLGSKGEKPWGNVFGRLHLWFIAILSLAAAYAVGIYYMILHVPMLWPVAILEGFFVFSYNLEMFGGRFHTDYWFAFSWGFLPVLAGYVMQANEISAEAVLLGLSMALLSHVEIKASRPYKELKKRLATLGAHEKMLMERYETILKSLSLGVMVLGAALLMRKLAS